MDGLFFLPAEDGEDDDRLRLGRKYGLVVIAIAYYELLSGACCFVHGARASNDYFLLKRENEGRGSISLCWHFFRTQPDDDCYCGYCTVSSYRETGE